MDLVVLIDAPGLVACSTTPLLKPRDAAAIVDADGLLRRARAHDEALRAQTATAFENARQSGFDLGLTQAREAMAMRLALALAARQVALRDLTPVLVDVVVDAVALIARNTPRRALIGSAIETVGGLLRQARWARLRVHASQLAEARAAVLEARGELAAAEMITVVADAAVDADACLFETDVGIADASLAVQLAAIRVAVGAAIEAGTDVPPGGVAPAGVAVQAIGPVRIEGVA